MRDFGAKVLKRRGESANRLTRRTRVLMVMLVLVLAAGLLAGCGAEAGSDGSSDGSDAASSAAKESSGSAASEKTAAAAVRKSQKVAGKNALQTAGSTIDLTKLEHRSTKKGSVVYFTSDISSKGMQRAYRALKWKPSGKVAVKLSTGEPPNSNYLRPKLIRGVVKQTNGTIVENLTAYGGDRSEPAMAKQVAKDHGFTKIAKFDLLDEDGSMKLKVRAAKGKKPVSANGKLHLKADLVGSHTKKYRSMLVLSHFKGHAMGGFGGAIKNTSIGMASKAGKCRIHTAGASDSSWLGGDQDAFLESMAEASKAVYDYYGKGSRIVYINVMNRLSVDCDCDGNPSKPDMHDIGILASTDPVALDQACVDLIYAAPDGQSVVKRIESRNGSHTLENAAAIGLGSRTYRLKSLDKK